MGTHPIFESDFDCLTEREKMLARAVRRFASMECTAAQLYKLESGPATEAEVTPEEAVKYIL